MALFKLAASAALALVLPFAAGAQTFSINHTTGSDLNNRRFVVALTAITAPGQFQAGVYDITGLTGTRATRLGTRSTVQAITGFDDFSTFYLPQVLRGGSGYPTYVDGLNNFTYSTGGGDYQVTRNASDFYNEFFSGGTNLILPRDFSIARAGATAPVPEPASWAMMVAGFAAWRRRRVAERALA